LFPAGSGNVTEPGTTADLEWMHRVGIAGMQMFDGDMGAPLYIDKPVIWMSPEWKSAWRHAAAPRFQSAPCRDALR
jgi:hypothetical protein